ncbi:Sulfoquinovosyl transferase SQD2 [Camellia lanceoleosa]|uniref:Sulfoquinovosyl transferase SQD2 n=1 Tax=Camellia lanceoleosa TaxID=1840588 RepID=A0ACC0G179_9ERIC|nr:Sulfoquinovosyl transferase SQD2 [Camellia lanceoleosa]
MVYDGKSSEDSNFSEEDRVVSLFHASSRRRQVGEGSSSMGMRVASVQLTGDVLSPTYAIILQFFTRRNRSGRANDGANSLKDHSTLLQFFIRRCSYLSPSSSFTPIDTPPSQKSGYAAAAHHHRRCSRTWLPSNSHAQGWILEMAKGLILKNVQDQSFGNNASSILDLLTFHGRLRNGFKLNNLKFWRLKCCQKPNQEGGCSEDGDEPPNGSFPILLRNAIRLKSLRKTQVSVCVVGKLAALAKELEAARVTAGNKIRLWNKGVDSESFHPKYRSQEMRIRLSNGEPERPLIVHVGRLGVEKSLDLLKSVMDQIPEARIAFIGDGPYSKNHGQNLFI